MIKNPNLKFSYIFYVNKYMCVVCVCVVCVCVCVCVCVLCNNVYYI